MRLLHVIHSADPAGGGPIEGIQQLARIYKVSKIDAELVSLDEPGSAFVSSFPLPVHAMGPTSLGRYGYAKRLLPWLRENHHKYDCVVVNGIWQYHSYACWSALRNTATPYVVFTHGMLDPWFKHHYPLKHMKKWLYWPWAEYRILRDAGAVLFTSEEEKLLAAKTFWLYKANAVVVGYGTRTPEFDLGAARETFLAEYPALRNKKLATFVGRIHPKKGCDLLLEAFAKTLAHDPQWHLLMVGPDQVGWQAELSKHSHRLGIADRITWTGMLRGERKWGALAASEIFALPSHQENFGIVVAEALACGVPALISKRVNIWREIQDESAGFAEPDTLDGTIKLLSRWKNLTEAERDAMKSNSRRCFQNNFDLTSSSSRYLELIRNLAGPEEKRIRLVG